MITYGRGRTYEHGPVEPAWMQIGDGPRVPIEPGSVRLAHAGVEQSWRDVTPVPYFSSGSLSVDWTIPIASRDCRRLMLALGVPAYLLAGTKKGRCRRMHARYSARLRARRRRRG